MRYIFILLVLLCVSCGTALPTVKPYKLDVQQGNVVTSKMLLQLRPGMTKSQVRFVMGTPLIQDSFHGNRWDYVYQMREGGKLKEQRRVILDFENELLKSVRGDVIPSGSDQSKVSEPEAPTGTRVVTPIKKPEDKSVLNKLKFWEKDEAEPVKQTAEKDAAAKAQLEVEEAAKNSTAKQSEDTSLVEEPKSLLAVPIVVPADIQNAAPPQHEVSPSPVPADVPKMEPAPVEALAPVVVPATEAQPAEIVPVEVKPAEAPAPIEPPVKFQTYDSSSGMQFDRKLQLETEEAEFSPQPAVVQPRAGNKVPPTPKDLPEEGDTSYFDRILEQIGF